MHVDLSRSEIEAALQTIELALGRRLSGLDEEALSALQKKLSDVCTLDEGMDDLDLDIMLEPADA